jgi:hypothetical protein
MDGNSNSQVSIPEEVALLELQLQALEIIDDVLSGTGGHDAQARESLMGHVARNPGQPQRALLLHMLSIRHSGLS